MIRRFFARILLSLLLFACLWAAGFAWFVWQIPREHHTSAEHTDAIVVLTGGSQRIDYGVQLLIDGKASRLFISGVDTKLPPMAFLRQVSPALAAQIPDGHAIVMLGYDARNTIGNAAEAAQWLQHEHLQSLRLVTANYHMPRALKEFRFAMPAMLILPDPVIPKDFDIAQWWRSEEVARLLLSEYHKLLAAQLRHWLVLWEKNA